MTIIYCDRVDCKHCRDDICQRTSIILDNGEWCLSCEKKAPASVTAEQGA